MLIDNWKDCESQLDSAPVSFLILFLAIVDFKMCNDSARAASDALRVLKRNAESSSGAS